MKTRIGLLLVSMMLLTCGTSDVADGRGIGDQNDTIRIMHYNVGAFRKTETSSIEYIAGMARECGASFISMNELDSCTARTGNVFQARAFAEELGGWNYHFSKAMPYQGGGYGVAIATAPERKMDTAYTISLEKGDGREPRALSVVECGNVVFATTHLDHRGKTSQICQAEKVSSTLKSRYKGSGRIVILCGDMNADPSSETIEVFENDWTIVSNMLQFTYPAASPSKCIDYIMVLKDDVGYSVLKSGVRTGFTSGDVKLASDHLPLEATIVRSSTDHGN